MSNIEEILEKFYRTQTTKRLASIFEKYVKSIGATKLDRRRKDTSNTYMIDGDSTGWNRVECYYYRNSGDWKKYGKFEFCITLRKRSGNYLLINVGNENCEIKRVFEISFGKIIHYDKELMEELIKKHAKLFSMMCDLEDYKNAL